MVVIYGRRQYGTVRAREGGAYVSTEFWHFDFLPIWPMESGVFHKSAANDVMLFPLKRLFWRSVILGWTRAGLIVAMLLYALSLLDIVRNQSLDDKYVVIGATFGALAALLAASYRLASVGSADLLRLSKDAPALNQQTIDLLQPREKGQGGKATSTVV